MARLMQMVPAPEEATTYYVWDDGTVTYTREGLWHYYRVLTATEIAERRVTEPTYHAAEVAVDD